MKTVKKAALVIAAAGVAAGASTGTALANAGGAEANGAAAGSPGVISGNTLQVPISIPVNICGNTVNIIGLLNPAMGNKCANLHHHTHNGHHVNMNHK